MFKDLHPYGKDRLHPAAFLLAHAIRQTLPDPDDWGQVMLGKGWSAKFHLMNWVNLRIQQEGMAVLPTIGAWLAQHNAIDIFDEYGTTPLMGAISSVHSSWRAGFVQQLLNHGAKVDRVIPPSFAKPESTPLIEAVQHNQLDVVELLIGAGANINQVWNGDSAALDIALSLDGFQALTVERLLSLGARPTRYSLQCAHATYARMERFFDTYTQHPTTQKKEFLMVTWQRIIIRLETEMLRDAFPKDLDHGTTHSRSRL